MSLTKQEIVDRAARYVQSEEITDFAYNGDLFCLLIRDIPENKVLSEEDGWQFNGYGICTGYTLDEEAKPLGKWLWMHFVSLETFPPTVQVIKLQPPHIIKGRFFNPQRTREIRILKVSVADEKLNRDDEGAKRVATPKESESKIVEFRKPKTR